MMDSGAERYDTLRIRVDRGAAGEYHTLAMAPDGRTVRGSFRMPMSDDELEVFVRKVGLVRKRRGASDDRLNAIKATGAALFDALFSDQIADAYNAARAAALDGDRGLRISLGFSGAPELLRLPWELLYNRRRFLASSKDTPVVRTLDVDSRVRPYPVRLPLRVLGIVSSPVGYDELDALTERENLEAALAPLQREGLVELIWLERPTLQALGRRISEPDEIHIIHYIGHGAYDEATEAGILVLERSDGRADEVGGDRLGAMLQDERSLRLVVLNSCEGARTSLVDPFSGTATSLIEFDIPAVIGMQFEITDHAAIAFSDALYRGLAQGMPVDAAVAPARRAIMAIREAEFGTPVLFLRDGDAHLFDIEVPSVRPHQKVTPRPDGDRGGAAPDRKSPRTAATGDAHHAVPVAKSDIAPKAAATRPKPRAQRDKPGAPAPRVARAETTASPAGEIGTRESRHGPAWWSARITKKRTDSVDEVKLQLFLDHDHGFVVRQRQGEVTLDGVLTTGSLPQLFKITDGGTTRVCAFPTAVSWGSLQSGQVDSCYVDGIKLNFVGGTSTKSGARPTRPPAGVQASIQEPERSAWRASTDYIPFGSLRGVVRINLRLIEDHSIVIRIRPLTRRIEVDGVEVARGFMVAYPLELEVMDAGRPRKCTVESAVSLPGTDFPNGVDFILAVMVDGVPVLIQHGDPHQG